MDLADGLRVVADDGEIRMIVLNLAQNACHAMPTGGTLRVTTRREGAQILMEFRDTGVGIPPEELDLVFARFYRGSNALAAHTEGLGLGLPVAKAIAEAHGGEICAQSAVDQGTVIAVRLPMVGRLRVAA
jgi:signal transduction histidine kinase